MDQAPTIYVIRHGRTDWNAQGRMQGQRDIPLDDTGRDQARRNGRTLMQILVDCQAIDFVSSPLCRATETMALIRAELDLPPDEYRLDDRLKEINFGDWEGRTRKTLSKETSELVDARDVDGWNFCSPNGESYAQMSTRIADWLNAVRQNTVMVAHGGVIRILQVLVSNAPRHLAPRLPAPQDQVMCIKDNRIEWI